MKSTRRLKKFPVNPHQCHSSVPCSARAATVLQGQPLSRQPECMWQPIRWKPPAHIKSHDVCFSLTINCTYTCVCVRLCVNVCVIYVTMLGKYMPASGGVHLGCVIVCRPVYGDDIWHSSVLSLCGFHVKYDILLDSLCIKMLNVLPRKNI